MFDLVTDWVIEAAELSLSHAAGQTSTFQVLDTAAATCLTTRITLGLLVVLSAVVRRTADRDDDPGANPTFHLMMPHLIAAVSSCMKTFPDISTASSWSWASSFVGF
jgi:hypothetical protein